MNCLLLESFNVLLIALTWTFAEPGPKKLLKKLPSNLQKRCYFIFHMFRKSEQHHTVNAVFVWKETILVEQDGVENHRSWTWLWIMWFPMYRLHTCIRCTYSIVRVVMHFLTLLSSLILMHHKMRLNSISGFYPINIYIYLYIPE